MDLYTDNILDHYQNPRNKGILSKSSLSAEDVNPLCGDKIRMDVLLDQQGKVSDVRFDGQGCAISQTSASMLTEEMLGKTLAELWDLENEDVYELLGIPISPARIKCALLSLVVLKKSLVLAKHDGKHLIHQMPFRAQ